jgi:hypothetical protein
MEHGGSSPITRFRDRARVIAFFAVAGGVAVSLASLWFDVVTVSDDSTGEVASFSGVLVAFIGAIGPLGMQFGWYANVMVVVTWALAVWMPPSTIATVAVVCCGLVTAFLAMSSFITLSASPLSAGSIGSPSSFVSFGPAIYLWTIGMCSGLVAALPSVVFEVFRRRMIGRNLE